jgi:hypothetical protein
MCENSRLLFILCTTPGPQEVTGLLRHAAEERLRKCCAGLPRLTLRLRW